MTGTCLTALLYFSLCFQDLKPGQFLPPTLPWQGKSESLIVAKDNPWCTPAEKSDLTASPSFEETQTWLQMLAAASPHLSMVSIGQSHEGRDIWMVIADKSGYFSPDAPKQENKAVILIQAGIHAGEIDGKDAGMMLLRDMTVTGKKSSLLDHAVVLFIPILNVDGHEIASSYNRINQRGPEVMGWRTNARNQNLNRDWGKLDTPGAQAVVKILNRWQPDLYLDVHVTDGMDYQYDITFGYPNGNGYSPNISNWLDKAFRPHVSQSLVDMGHIPGPLIFALDGNNPDKGLLDWAVGIRFSQAYGDARHMPSILIENHSLKPFRQRVLGTYVLLASAIEIATEQRTQLQDFVQKDKEIRPQELVLTWTAKKEQPSVDFAGIAWEKRQSDISGSEYVTFLGQAKSMKLPMMEFTQPGKKTKIPNGYLVPPTYPEIIERLHLHGIAMTRLDQSWKGFAQVIRFTGWDLSKEAFEGRMMITAEQVMSEEPVTTAPGTMYVPTDQPLGTLAVLLLEPQAPDSFFSWGFILEILQRTEYFEAYAMEPLAKSMLERDPMLKVAFEKKLAQDPNLAKDPAARLDWFFRQTPYFDRRFARYPILRVKQAPVFPKTESQ